MSWNFDYYDYSVGNFDFSTEMNKHPYEIDAVALAPSNLFDESLSILDA